MFDWKALVIVFIVGFVSDLIIQELAVRKILGASLMPYYLSLQDFPPAFVPRGVKYRLYGAILGGLACAFAMAVTQMIMPYV
jgi:hypothetical protein